MIQRKDMLKVYTVSNVRVHKAVGAVISSKVSSTRLEQYPPVQAPKVHITISDSYLVLREHVKNADDCPRPLPVRMSG